MPSYFSSYSSSLIKPTFIKLQENLIMASFQLMKLIPAHYVVNKALQTGKLDPRYPVIETSSGTYALGLGIACAEHQMPFHIISDPAIDIHLKRRLQALGGKVQILSHNISSDNIQILRLNTLQEYLNDHPKAFWPCQYDNPENRIAYQDFAECLLENFGNDFTLVGSVGSGGSTSGAMHVLRQANPAISLVGVDTFGSVLFGMPAQKRLLRGLGNSIMPKNLQHDLFDEVHWVSAENAFYHTRYLHDKKAIFCGPTTGAAYQAAKWTADRNKDRLVIFISADTGHRYQSTIYNNSWFRKNNLNIEKPTAEPSLINNPGTQINNWAYLNWNRRELSEVIA